MSDGFNKDGWILDFADTSRRLHLLCEQWLYYHGSSHGEDEECEMCEDVGAIFALTKELLAIYGVKIGQPAFEFGEPEVKAARFGCIGCPAIGAEADAPRSVIARNGADSPLNEIYAVWNEARLRRNRCWKWHAKVSRTRNYGFGPIKLAVRKQLFVRILDIQRRSGVILITSEDEAFICECWAKKVYPRGWSEADELVEPPSEELLFPAKESQ